MRKKIVAGNWKMNLELEDAINLFNHLNNKSNSQKDVEIIIAPPSLYLGLFADNSLEISLSSQNVSHHPNGAFTGELSSSMLSSLDIKYSIIGHSERRTYQKESDELIFQKAKSLISNELQPIFCCGELLNDRNNGNAFDVVSSQLSLILKNFSEQEFSNIVIAYEPVWAIGTGLTASASDAQQMHQHIRNLITESFNAELANNISIIYGGSCKPQNAKELFSQEDIDGGLIGGAALQYESFMSIVKAF